MTAAERVVLALNSHAENGTLPLAGGLIDRSAIATQLGLPAEVQQTAEVEAAFHKADQLAGHLLPSRTLGLREAQAAARHAAAATVDAHLRLMEANGEWMPVSRGKISRSGICDPLGLSESLRRSPEVEAVFHAADERAGREAGPSSQFDQFAPRLQELLTGADIELRNGRVPLVWAAKALGLKPYQVRNAPALRKQLDGFNRPDLAAVGVPKIPKVRRERAVAWLGLPSRQMGGYAQLTIDQDRLCRDAHLNSRATMFCGSLVHDAAIAVGLRPASPTAPKPYAKKLCTWIQLRDMLAPLDRIYELRGLPGVDAPNFEPFPYGIAPAARPVGESVGRTPTPPARQYMFLLDRSMRWVADYGPSLVDALEHHQRGELFVPPSELQDLPATPFPLAQFRKAKDGQVV